MVATTLLFDGDLDQWVGRRSNVNGVAPLRRVYVRTDLSSRSILLQAASGLSNSAALPSGRFHGESTANGHWAASRESLPSARSNWASSEPVIACRRRELRICGASQAVDWQKSGGLVTTVDSIWFHVGRDEPE